MTNFSRRAFIEERRNIKKIYFYLFLSLLGLIFLIFLGIPILVKFAGFVGNFAKINKPIQIQDKIPPAPPQFDDLPEYTNTESLNISGTSENGAIIEILANNNLSEVVADNNGRFLFLFNLNEGENTISATSRDTSNNKSTETKTYRIIFDNTEPKLEILSPKEGESFYGNSQRQVSIKGTLNEQVNLKINNRSVPQNEDYSFVYTTTLNEGANSFNIKAIDYASNLSEATISVNFTP